MSLISAGSISLDSTFKAVMWKYFPLTGCSLNWKTSPSYPVYTYVETTERVSHPRRAPNDQYLALWVLSSWIWRMGGCWAICTMYSYLHYACNVQPLSVVYTLRGLFASWKTCFCVTVWFGLIVWRDSVIRFEKGWFFHESAFSLSMITRLYPWILSPKLEYRVSF